MSLLDFSDCEEPFIKNDLNMSDLNISLNEYAPFKEEEKSLSEESNFEKFIKKEFGKSTLIKKSIDYTSDDDMDDTYRYEIKKVNPKSPCNNNLNNFKTSTNFFSNFNLSNISNDNNLISGCGNNKIFKIVKTPKNKKIFQCLQRKKEYDDRNRKYFCDWENIAVPKEKHFHFDRKKHRIVFQRRHLKVIYSIVDLAYPFNFSKCFDIIKKHIGDKTVQNYKEGKSFHIIKINNEEKIVTLKDKKLILKGNKMNKKNLNHNNLKV